MQHQKKIMLIYCLMLFFPSERGAKKGQISHWSKICEALNLSQLDFYGCQAHPKNLFQDNTAHRTIDINVVTRDILTCAPRETAGLGAHKRRVSVSLVLVSTQIYIVAFDPCLAGSGDGCERQRASESQGHPICAPNYCCAA